MSSAIQNILERTLGDLARSSKYEVFFSFLDPTVNIGLEDLIMMGKTASFPGKQHTTIDFKYKGRSMPIKGQTKYTQTWECTFHLTEDHLLKSAFENWVEALDQTHNYIDISKNPSVGGLQNIHNTTGNYTRQIFIYQKNFFDDSATAEYVLENAFPIEVSPVQTSYESIGSVQEFTVTFAYSHYTSRTIKGQKGNFIDEIVATAEKAVRDAITKALQSDGDGSINEYVKDLFNSDGKAQSQTNGSGYKEMKDTIQNELNR